MSDQGFSMLCARIGTRGLPACGTRERGIEVVFRPLQQLDLQRRRRRNPSFCFVGGVNSRRIVAGEVASLQLSDPVGTFRQGEGRVTGQAPLERALSEIVMVERAKFCCLATERPNEREWRGDHVGRESELYPA